MARPSPPAATIGADSFHALGECRRHASRFQTFTPAGGATIKGLYRTLTPAPDSACREYPAPVVLSPSSNAISRSTSPACTKASASSSSTTPTSSPAIRSCARRCGATRQAGARRRSDLGEAEVGAVRPHERFRSPVGVNPAPKLPTPVLVAPICPNAAIVRVRNLRPGATVTLFGETQAPSGSSASAQIGRPARGHRLRFRAAAQLVEPSAVDHQSGETVPLPRFKPTAIAAATQRNTPSIRCRASSASRHGQARRVRAIHRRAHVDSGAVIVVHSDQADWPILTPPVFVTAQNMPIGLYRKLRANEKVQIKQTGCNAAVDLHRRRSIRFQECRRR